MPLPREQATASSDIPHAYQPDATERCTVCQALQDDELHNLWVQQQTAGRERASEFIIPRELGTAL